MRPKSNHPLFSSSTSHYRFSNSSRPSVKFSSNYLRRNVSDQHSDLEDNDHFSGLTDGDTSSSEEIPNYDSDGEGDSDPGYNDDLSPTPLFINNISGYPSPPLQSFDIRLRRQDSLPLAARRKSTHRRSTVKLNGNGNVSSSDDNAEDEDLSEHLAERIQFQQMLNNVLSGEVFKSEKTRLSSNLSHQAEDRESKKKLLAHFIWLKVRAVVNGRKNLDQEQRFLEEARKHIPPILDLVMAFRVSDDVEKDGTAEVQVSHLLRKIEWCETLYPSTKSLGNGIPAYADPEFSVRLDALRSWQSITRRLSVTLGILQKWTGSESLKITEADTNLDETERGGALVDNSSFLERISREGGIQEIFNKSTLVSVLALVRAARETMVANSRLFNDLNLPTGFTHNLVLLVNFTPSLMQATLRQRLNYANKIRDPSPPAVLINQLTDDFRTGLTLAFRIKREFLEIAEPDPSTGWALSIEDEAQKGYDETLVDSVKLFNKLLDWKLKSPDKQFQFQETELIESHWKFLSERVAGFIDGGDLLVGEHFASLTARLMVHVTENFKEQLARLEVNRNTSTDLMRWFNQMLDNIRTRHRKLLRFARNMLQRFENSSEYNLRDVDLHLFMKALEQSGHFLIRTFQLEKGTDQGGSTYIIGSPSLWNDEEMVKRILTKCFSLEPQMGLRRQLDLEEDAEPGSQEQSRYVLMITPGEPFVWFGRVADIEIPPTDFDLHERRVRLVSDGPMNRLTKSKSLFLNLFPHFRNRTVVENMAHLESIARQLRRIRRSANRLSETIVTSAGKVDEAIQKQGNDNYQGMMISYFVFAADLGVRSLKHMDSRSRGGFNLKLIRLAIQWVSFICDGCQPDDQSTFKWAVAALEFITSMTKGDNIQKLNSDEFFILRSKVADCMTLLISHFDIMGVRSGHDKAKRQEALDDSVQGIKQFVSRRLLHLQSRDVDTQDLSQHQSQILQALAELERQRQERGEASRTVGKVLDYQGQDRSLLLLASSSSNINIRWQQGKFIGAGASGSVYMAVNLDTTEMMAVKEIRFQDTTSTNSLINQITDEMTVMSTIKHPNIVEYYGIEVHRDKVYIFEEFCQGGSLAGVLEHGRLEDEEIIMLYAYQLLNGLQYLHEHNIVHRDIKPDNILLDQMGTAKFVDFGAAKILANNSRTMGGRKNVFSRPDKTPKKSLTGTPMYMSPEAIKTTDPGRTGAMDIWSLGCVLLECATGKRPWANLDNQWAVMYHIGKTMKHPPLPEPGQLSDLGIDFIRQCLTVDPEKRPTATELLEHPWMTYFQDTLGNRYEQETAGHSSLNTLVESPELFFMEKQDSIRETS